jgi:hypothetical protein
MFTFTGIPSQPSSVSEVELNSLPELRLVFTPHERISISIKRSKE